MCKADPPGWRDKNEWYNGGANYNKPHVWVPAGEWGAWEQPVSFSIGLARKSCLYCGKWMADDEDIFVQSEGEKVTTGDQK